MSDANRYVKIVEWSEADRCFVGSCSGLFYGGCHGEDEQRVFAKFSEIVEETLRIYREDNKALPPATAGRDYANRILNVA
jgi:predicted RNase H-like HicB family nuclease